MSQAAPAIGQGVGILAGTAGGPQGMLVGDQLGGALGSAFGGMGGGTPSVAPVAPPPMQHQAGSLLPPIVGHSTAPQGPLTGGGQASSQIQQLLQNMLMSGRATG